MKLLIKFITGIFEDYKPYLSKFANGRKLVLPLLMHSFETVSTKAKGESLWPIASPYLYSGRRKKRVLVICQYSPVMY